MCGLCSGICKLNAFRFGKTALKEGLKPEAITYFTEAWPTRSKSNNE